MVDFNRNIRIMVVALLAIAAGLGAYALLESADSDAASHGSSTSPLSSLSLRGSDIITDTNKDYYVYVGSIVEIVADGDGGGNDEFGYDITGVTSGFGLTYDSTYPNPEGAGTGKVSGTISKAGNISVTAYFWQPVGDNDNGSITIHAVQKQTATYTSTLKYNANGGTGAPANQTYTGTETTNHIFKIASGTPTKSGYTFMGWANTSTATTPAYQAGDNISVGYKNTRILYAVWQQESATTYEVTVYKGNWGSFMMLSDGVQYTTDSHTYTVASGTTIDIDWYGKEKETTVNNGKTTVTTYTSSGYNMAKSLYGTSIGNSVTVAESTSYYPATMMQSTSTITYSYKLNFNANGGTGAPESLEGESSNPSESTWIPLDKPTRTGYTFLGWSESSNATTPEYLPDNDYTFDYGETTLYAVWEKDVQSLKINSVAKQYGVVGKLVPFNASCSPSGVSVTYTVSDKSSSNLTTTVSMSTIYCKASVAGTYTFTLTASASGYESSSTTVTVQIVPALAFTNAPSIGVIGS